MKSLRFAFGLVLAVAAFGNVAEGADKLQIRNYPFETGRLAFTYTLGDSVDIYVADFSTQEIRPLIESPALDEAPDWSPDGKQIVFHSERDGNREIYVADANGQNVRRLTNNKVRDQNPRWTPDGQSIVFDSDQPGDSPNIFIMNVDGSKPRALTNDANGNYSPAVSPRGDEIAFVSSNIDFPSSDLIVLDLASGKTKQLSRTRLPIGRVSWDATGSRLAFSWGFREGPPEMTEKIWILERGQTEPVPMGSSDPQAGEALERDPQWADKNSSIFFAGEVSDQGRSQIFFHNLEKKKEMQITDGPGSARRPTWTPLPFPPVVPAPATPPPPSKPTAPIK